MSGREVIGSGCFASLFRGHQGIGAVGRGDRRTEFRSWSFASQQRRIAIGGGPNVSRTTRPSGLPIEWIH